MFAVVVVAAAAGNLGGWDGQPARAWVAALRSLTLTGYRWGGRAVPRFFWDGRRLGGMGLMGLAGAGGWYWRGPWEEAS